jgi:transposase
MRPTQLDLVEFEQFVLPHLSPGSRGPAPKLSLQKIFNYILKHLYLGCQWKELPIDKAGGGRPETHYTRIYRIWRRWVDSGCIDAIFAGSVSRLHQDGLLDTAIIHGDGTTAAAKKGGDNLGFSGHKKVKGDKVVAFCDRHCNVIAPFVAAPGNRNESPLLREALPEVMRISRAPPSPLSASCPKAAWNETNHNGMPQSALRSRMISVPLYQPRQLPPKPAASCKSSSLPQFEPDGG